MRIYPIRTSRNQWNIKIFCNHMCNHRCETIITNREDDLICISINPSFINNTCNLSGTLENGTINLNDFDKNNPMCENGPLVNPDEVVIVDKSFSLNINFPLSYVFTMEIRASQEFTKRHLIYFIKNLYKFIYDEEERTATPQLYKLNKICSNCNLQSLETFSEDVRHDDECSICFNSLNEDSLKLKCSHMFHKACITQWIANSATCPICRHNIFMCTNCNGTRIVFYYFRGIVIPLDQRGAQINRNISNGIFGIHSYDFEDLILSNMIYDRINKNLILNISGS